MPTDTASLLRQWPLLQTEVVPPLVEARSARGEARAWAVGDLADAVAVAVAFHAACADGCGDAPPLETYSTGPDGSAPPAAAATSFRLADIRVVPHPVRDGAFERATSGWRPAEALAERVFLGRPTGPVDVITIRIASDGPGVGGEILSRLAPGGRLVVVDGRPPGVPPPGTSPVGRTGLVFRMDDPGRVPPDRSRPDPGVATEPPGTLADRLTQAELVLSHANLARSLARRFAGHGESRQDLDQVALLALVKAASRFDPGRDTTFSTFATSTILGELKRHFRDKTWMLRVPRSVQETYLAIKDARESLTHELSRSPTIAEVSERLGTSDEQVLEAMEAGENYWPESLDARFPDDDSGRDVPTHDAGFDHALEHHELAVLLPRLAQRERLLLRRIYLDGWTQRQVAEELGVSQMQVSRLLGTTLRKLRAWAR